MKLYLVRHGETTGNKDNFYQTEETPLTANGIAQAKKVAGRLKEIKIDLIYSSTHQRAKNTSEIISEETGVPVEYWERLAEIRRPKEVRGKSADDPEVNKIMDQVISNFATKDWKYSDEENFFDLRDRANQVLEHLIQKHGKSDVVCVSHGTFIKFMVANALFGDTLTPEIFSKLRHHFYSENTGVSIMDYKAERGFKLLTWNDMSHL